MKHLRLDFIEDVALIFGLLFTNDQFFACLGQVMLVDVINHSGTLHSSGIKIGLAINAEQLIEGFGGK